jgi:hypothetical protein
MATKKSSTKKGRKNGLKAFPFEDPPVQVGGGNSVDIIFKNTATNPTGPAGKKKFRLPNSITSVIILDGTDPIPKLVPVSDKFSVYFY